MLSTGKGIKAIASSLENQSQFICRILSNGSKAIALRPVRFYIDCKSYVILLGGSFEKTFFFFIIHSGLIYFCFSFSGQKV